MVPAASPVSKAASSVTVPTIESDGIISGNISLGILAASKILFS